MTNGPSRGATCRLKRSPVSPTNPKSGCPPRQPDQSRTLPEVGALTPCVGTRSRTKFSLSDCATEPPFIRGTANVSFPEGFRCGQLRDMNRLVVAVHVDKYRKDEAAGCEALAMGKERRRWGPLSTLVTAEGRSAARSGGLHRERPLHSSGKATKTARLLYFVPPWANLRCSAFSNRARGCWPMRTGREHTMNGCSRFENFSTWTWCGRAIWNAKSRPEGGL